MPRLCERPGCSAPADVAYGFDAETLVVWLDRFDGDQGPRVGVLCRRHADAMVVPLGWMLDDRREPVPRLFSAASMNDLTDGLSRPRARRSRGDRTLEMIRTAAMQLSLEEVGIADGVVVELDPSATAAPARPEIPPQEVAAPEIAPQDAPEQMLPGQEAPEQDAQVLPWQPRFDPSDDLSGLLQARGRLLSRAFRGVAADGA